MLALLALWAKMFTEHSFFCKAAHPPSLLEAAEKLPSSRSSVYIIFLGSVLLKIKSRREVTGLVLLP